MHDHLTFAYRAATRGPAADVHQSGYGVCRDFTHLAVSFCRALNIRRYVFGYLPLIGNRGSGLADGFRSLDGGLAG